MPVLGYAVAFVGLVLMIIGVFGAAAAVSGEKGQGFAGAGDTIASILRSMPALIDSLGKAPKWLAMILVGLLLLLAGDRLAAGAWPFA